MAAGRLCVAVGAVSLWLAVAPSAALAVLPRPDARFEAHDHETPGDGWHVELEVSRDPRIVRSLVLYSERCQETIAATAFPIAEDGSVSLSRPFSYRDERGGQGQGVWRLDARFVMTTGVHGSFQITAAGCDSGIREFVAVAQGAVLHPALGYPDARDGTPAEWAAVRGLWRRSLATARRRFPTYAAARRAGFEPTAVRVAPPYIFHVRRRGYDRDGRTLDPRRPESIVFWAPGQAAPVPVGLMFRAPADRRPRLGGRILKWHRHIRDGRPGGSAMTHIWLTGDVFSAAANCLPVAELEAALPRFRYARPSLVGTHETIPCPDRPAPGF